MNLHLSDMTKMPHTQLYFLKINTNLTENPNQKKQTKQQCIKNHRILFV